MGHRARGPGAIAEGPRRRQSAAAAHRVVVGGRTYFAHRLRKSVEPRPGASGGAEQGIRHAQRAGRRARKTDPPSTHREYGAFDGGRGAGAWFCFCDDVLSRPSRFHCAALAEQAARGWRGARVDAAGGDGKRGSFRSCAGVQDVGQEHSRGSERVRPRNH